MKNFKNTLEIIKEALFDTFGGDVPKETENFLNACYDGYILIGWPESQDYMDEDWFEDEAIFCGGSEDITGSSAYFIPIKRLI